MAAKGHKHNPKTRLPEELPIKVTTESGVLLECLSGNIARPQFFRGCSQPEQKGSKMTADDIRKNKNHPEMKPGLKRTLQGILERLKEGMDEIADGLRPANPQRVPIPLPVWRPRRR
jgi:hypothetical protein